MKIKIQLTMVINNLNCEEKNEKISCNVTFLWLLQIFFEFTSLHSLIIDQAGKHLSNHYNFWQQKCLVSNVYHLYDPIYSFEKRTSLSTLKMVLILLWSYFLIHYKSCCFCRNFKPIKWCLWSFYTFLMSGWLWSNIKVLMLKSQDIEKAKVYS